MDLTRRAVLLLPVLAGCTAASPEPEPVVDPDVALLAAAVDRERALLALYDAAAAVVPRSAATWSVLRDDHAQHLDALLALRPTATATPTATSTPTPVPPAVSARTARAALLRAEQLAFRDHARDVVPASAALAPLLASLAACEASHAAVL